MVLATGTDFLLFPTLGAVCTDFPSGYFTPLTFPIFLVGNPDFIFDSCPELRGMGTGITSAGEALEILPSFFTPFP
ncbi:MAG: hypothetical protein KC584_16240, partial [Nitrospira sp.]|nr:hypothetical protein [Nitrospira sp.]